MTSRVFSAAGFRQSSIVGSLSEVGCAWASSASVRDDSVDFPNPILTCLQMLDFLHRCHLTGYEKKNISQEGPLA